MRVLDEWIDSQSILTLETVGKDGPVAVGWSYFIPHRDTQPDVRALGIIPLGPFRRFLGIVDRHHKS